MKVKENFTNSKILKYSKHGKAKKNDDLVAAMYAMYKTGKSYQTVARNYRKDPKTVFDMFKLRGYELRSSLRLPSMRIDGIKFIKGNTEKYWRSSIEGGIPRIMLSNYIWLKHNGPVPKDHRVIFIDFNPDNVNIENLKCVTIQEAAKHRKSFLNQFTSKTGSKMKSGQRKRLQIDLGWERAKQFNVSQ